MLQFQVAADFSVGPAHRPKNLRAGLIDSELEPRSGGEHPASLTFVPESKCVAGQLPVEQKQHKLLAFRQLRLQEVAFKDGSTRGWLRHAVQ